jgi:CRISPR-associated exonuclease Cas4
MSKSAEQSADSGLSIDTGAEINWENKIQDALKRTHDEESHLEQNHDRFHPSQLAYKCDRQVLLAKLGLKDVTDILGTFKTGTLIHEFLEEHLKFESAVQEHPIEYEYDGVTITGTVDLFHPGKDLLVDFKTRAGWYNFDPPNQRHVNQLTLYQAALGKPKAKIVYISKKDMEVRIWPEEGRHTFDADRFEYLMERAKNIQSEIAENGVPTCEEEIPFEKCGCYICSQEVLQFPK